MQVKSAEFLKSSSFLSQCPAPAKPEFAFIGRSNVGKSSLINMVVNKKNMAKTSSTPGKTRLINHFVINAEERNPWYLVDLPGYGYAKIAKTEREKWEKMIEEYLNKRENLLCTMVLVDVRHEPQKLDIDFCLRLGELGLPFAMIFTKADKEKPAVIERNVSAFCNALLEYYSEMPNYFLTSAEKRTGREDLLKFLDNVMTQSKNQEG
jgi:GTP-binding protein